MIGSLSFLRNLCTTADARRMARQDEGVIEARGSPARRDRLAGPTTGVPKLCPHLGLHPAAHEASARFLAEGERLSHAWGRFGG